MAVLYRKYRPTKLEDVVGQEQVTSVLANAVKSGKIAHAFLFIGPRGTGKTSVARILAHAINNFDYQVEDSYLDIIEIDAASNTGVDNIRELREKAVIAPTKGKYKVYIIDEVHMLTKSASNALLKTLEEPPEHVVFIMATTDAHKVPITISSRTQVHTFKLARPEIMLEHLQDISKTEGIKITNEALEIVVRRGGGSFRDSLSLLDQVATISGNDQEITAEVLNSTLGIPQEETVRALLASYSEHDNDKVHESLKDLLNSGIRPEILVSELIETIIAQPKPELMPLLAKLPDVSPPFPEAKLLLAFLGNSTSDTTLAVPTHPATTSVQTNQNQTAPKTVAPIKTAPLAPPEAPESSTKSEAPKDPTPPLQSPESPKNSLSEQKNTTKPTQTVPKTAPKSSDSEQDFDWSALLERIQSLNLAIYSQLTKVEYEFDGQILHLYPSQKFTKTILEKPNNAQIIVKELGDIKLVIHDIGARKTTEDNTISQISAIMGGVQEVRGDLPF